MMRSMFSGVSGLRVHQTKMDVIGNNIANVNTSGFKSSRVTFSEMFNQTLSGASKENPATGRGGVNPMQIGLGVNIATIDTLMTEGAAQRTDNPLDLKLEGEGFIVVKKNNASDQMYTRAGNLYLDSAGNLTAPGGAKVMGWMPNEKGEIDTKGQITELNILQGKSTIPAKATSNEIENKNGSFGVVLDGNINAATKLGETINIPFDVYDSLGNSFQISITITPKSDGLTPEAKLANMWEIKEYTITSKDKFVLDPTSATPTQKKIVLADDDAIDIMFKSDGTLDYAGDEGNKQLNFGFNAANTDEMGGDKVKLSAITPAPNPLTGDLLTGGAALNFNIDLATITQFSSSNTAKASQQVGYAPGTLSKFTIGSDGKIVGIYSNGEQQNLGQVAVATFQNPAGLEKTGENLFRATANSGQVAINEAGGGGAGKFNSGVLEMSNVDLSKEFTEMITTQRGFQANSKIISTSDEMLQELVNLKR